MKASQLIYYLDDDIDDLYLFKDVAEHMGHRVQIYINGNVMLHALEKKSKLPDIIFLDIHMPVFNGEEILNVIKKAPNWKHIPVVMISAAYPKKLVKSYLEAGANYLMKKPPASEWQMALAKVLEIDWTEQAYV